MMDWKTGQHSPIPIDPSDPEMLLTKKEVDELLDLDDFTDPDDEVSLFTVDFLVLWVAVWLQSIVYKFLLNTAICDTFSWNKFKEKI